MNFFAEVLPFARIMERDNKVTSRIPIHVQFCNRCDLRMSFDHTFSQFYCAMCRMEAIKMRVKCGAAIPDYAGDEEVGFGAF